MKLHFTKYEGAGNDFILIDNRTMFFDGENIELINWLCDRRFGIGADGLMLLEDHPEHDFVMRYFNADGKEASMCGNGGRCIVAFAAQMGIVKNSTTFIAVDGIHEATFELGIVDLKMIDVDSHKRVGDDYFMDTGSPHYVRFVDDITKVDVVSVGSSIRNSDELKPNGANVNFVEQDCDRLKVFTYERGVEDETLACGTGITASALCAALRSNEEGNQFFIEAKGGKLEVRFNRTDDFFTDVWLKGPATRVYDGVIQL